MSVKIIDNTQQIVNTTKQKGSIFLRTMADEIVNIADPVTPKKTGDLRRSVLKQVLGLKGKVVWSKEYAARQETTQFRNYTTGGTGPHYAEESVQKAIKETDKVARNSGLI